MDETGISVIICTYNGRLKIAQTLNFLHQQKGLDGVPWEIVIVDNASTDGSFSEIKKLIANKSTNTSLCNQPIEGKAAALKLAIEKSKYDYLVICDDDNWLNEYYLANIYQIFQTKPTVGIIGGNGEPVDIDSVPDCIVPHLHNYAAAAQWSHSADITTEIGSVYGAGMGIRKEIFAKISESQWPTYLSAFRKSNSIMSGEDTELGLIARHLGYRIYFDETLKFRHELSTARLTKKYLMQLAYANGFGTAVMLPYHEAFEKRKPKAFAYLLKLEFYRLLRYDLLDNLLHQKILTRKKLNFRLGFIKSLIVNRSNINNLREFLASNKF